MSEVGSELQVALQIVRVLFRYSTPLKLDGDTKDVLPSQGNGVPPLGQVSNYQISDVE